MAPYRIASLGSSYAAGPAIPPIVDKVAARSGLNYAHLVAKRLSCNGDSIDDDQVHLTDLSCSGATLGNLLKDPQRSMFSANGKPPQIDGVPVNADLVMVLGGGNDIGYIGNFIKDEASYMPLIGRCFGSADDDVSDTSHSKITIDEKQVAEISKRYSEVLDAVHTKAPKAQVLAVEYQVILGTHARPRIDVPFGYKRFAFHRSVAATLKEATAQAVKGREEWCSIVPVDAKSYEYGLGAPEPWMNGFKWSLVPGFGVYHPTPAGMRGVAELIYEQLITLGLVTADGKVIKATDEGIEKNKEAPVAS